MLKYLIAVSENAIAVSLLLGVLFAYVNRRFDRSKARVLAWGTAAGFVVAIIMALLRNTTKIMNRTGGTGMWNVRIFTISTVALIVYWLCSIRAERNRNGKTIDRVLSAAAAVLAFTFLIHALPEIFLYPFNFNLNGASVFSTAFFYRFIGYLAGVVLVVTASAAAYQVARRLELEKAGLILNIMLFINGFQQVTKALQVLHARRLVKGHWIFVLVRHTSNYSNLFIYALMLVLACIVLVLLNRSFHVNEPYENPAQHRKIKAKWRSTRRWCAALSICFALMVLNLTWFTAIDNRVIQLSPVEESVVRDGSVYVPLTQVEDGHLHRFAYTTPNGKTVRFIVIKKPNSSSYGIGLDACDICGETGYFERNGQIVCKLCDVVMNINTIGFKGGCNPIVIDYSIANGFIIVPVRTLIEHEKEFK